MSPDLGLTASDIHFSTETLRAGDDIRVYASVRNYGEVDTTGYVFFYSGTKPIGESQAITIPIGGAKDDVWVDFTVPYEAFNISATIRGQNPEDVNPSNDSALTMLFDPLVDDDEDGIDDAEDNCTDHANANQLDTDGDGLGDACDSDDDNDSVNDESEEDQGSDPLVVDTDGDGVQDASDAYPTDSSKTVLEKPVELPPIPVVTPQVLAAVDEDSEPVYRVPDSATTSSEKPLTTNTLLAIDDSSASEPVLLADRPSESLLDVATDASFTLEQIDWNTYDFLADIPENAVGMSWSWDFGDGNSSLDNPVEHTFEKPGSYLVTLTLTTGANEVRSESETIDISIFHLSNPLVYGTIGVIFFIILLVILMIIRGWVRDFRKKKEMSIDRS
jgi:hypothetical protein